MRWIVAGMMVAIGLAAAWEHIDVARLDVSQPMA